MIIAAIIYTFLERCLLLFFEFFKTGLFSIGGGMATLPFLYEMSDKYPRWFTHGELLDMIAISESTPGPIGVNMATYVGYMTAGVPGGILATLGLITPSIIIILLVTRALKAFGDNRYVQSAFYGLRPASTGLIASAWLGVLSVVLLNRDVFEKTGSVADLFHWESLALAVAIFAVTNFVKPAKKWHPLIFIAFSALVGIVFKL